MEERRTNRTHVILVQIPATEALDILNYNETFWLQEEDNKNREKEWQDQSLLLRNNQQYNANSYSTGKKKKRIYIYDD